MSHPYEGGHGGQYYGQQAPPAPRNGMGTAALVLGTVGVFLALIPLTALAGIICGIVGAVLGFVGVARLRSGRATNKVVAIAGLAMSVLAVIVAIVVLVTTAKAISDALGPHTVTPAVPGAAAGAAAGAPAQTEFEAGQAADIDGLVITAEPLKKVKPQYGSAQACSRVTYKNNSGEERNFNGLFDWKLQTPAGTIVSPGLSGNDTLSSGGLAPGGTVTGNVCFDGTAPGAYTIINEELTFGANTQVRWKTSL